MRGPRLVLLVALCWTLFLPAGAWAAHPLVTEDTETQGPGGVLIESSINYLKDNAFRSTVIPLMLTAGIGEIIDVGVEIPYLWLNPSAVTGNNEHGLSDVLFKLKQRFLEKDGGGEHGKFKQSLAYQLLYTQPSGDEDKGLGGGKSRWAARLISTTEWESVEVSANVGYDSSGRALRRGDLTFDDAVSGSISATYERYKPWEPVVELAAARASGNEALTRISAALVGMIYEPSETYYVDAGVRVGLNSSSEDYALLAGFGYKF
jgi:hypothetical protein